MLNLVLVGSGDTLEVIKFVDTLQKQLKRVLSQQDAHFYDLNTLWKAESDPDLLKRKGILKFPISSEVMKVYWGVIGHVDFDNLYSKWFSSNENEKICPIQYVYYSKSNLKEFITRLFVDSSIEKESPVYDFMIRYRYGDLDSKNSYCIIEWCINDETHKYESPYILHIFQNLINFLDESFPSVFTSAYITNNTEESIQNLVFFEHFDIDSIGSKILGVEYSFYICNRMSKTFNQDSAINCINYRVTKHTNGVQYTYNDEICSFAHGFNESAIMYFKGMIIPAYRIINWSNLCVLKEQFIQKPQTISIYYDKYSPTDPTIIFSSGYTSFQLDSLPAISGLSLQERYQIHS